MAKTKHITIGLREANQYLSRYIEAAENGEEVIITRRGRPVAKLVPAGDAQDDGQRRRAAVAAFLATRIDPPKGIAGSYRFTRADGYDDEHGDAKR